MDMITVECQIHYPTMEASFYIVYDIFILSYFLHRFISSHVIFMSLPRDGIIVPYDLFDFYEYVIGVDGR